MKLISRSDAKADRLKRYFSGEPCKAGHVSERLVSNGRCLECDREVKRRQLADNPEQVRERKRKQYGKDPEAHRQRAREYRSQNRDLVRQRDRQRTVENRDVRRERDRNYRIKNIEKVKARRKRYEAENPHILRAGEARRRARKRNAIPPWFDEFDAFVWEEAADLVIRRRDVTGVAWAADHMIPLAARNACGLHVAENCQVIPAKLNTWKNNKSILTQPREWIDYL